MRHERILNRDEAVLVVVDMQEAFRKYICDFDFLTKNISTLVQAAKLLEIPILVTEQYPRGLGTTVAELTAVLGGSQQFEKSCFSCCQYEPFSNALTLSGRRQVVVAGIEAHVCVNQTVHDLLFTKYQVHVAADAVGSRFPLNKEVAMEKMRDSGAIISTVEMCIFEMLRESGTDVFKSIQKLLK